MCVCVCVSDSPTLLIFSLQKIAEAVREHKFVCSHTEGVAGLICDLQQVSMALAEQRNECSSASHEHPTATVTLGLLLSRANP